MTRRPSSRGAGRQAIAAVTLVLLLAGCTFSTGRPEVEPRELPAGAFSDLDPAGVAQIEASRTARLDMRTGTLRKADVGLDPETPYGPEIDTRDVGPVDLTIVGPSGEVHADTDRIRFNTVDTRPDLSEVTYFLTADSFDGLVTLIRDGVDRYGVDARSARGWIRSTRSDPGPSDFSLGSGTSTGLEVNYDLRYDPGSSVQVVIVHVTPLG